MGTNTLSSRIDGEVIPSADHNELVEAFVVDLVPRNSSRVPTDIAGQLGTSAYRWLRAFAQEYFIGDAGNNLKIYEGATGEIWLERSSPSNEQLRIKNGSIEFYIGGSKVLHLNASGTSNTQQYIDYNTLKTRNGKISLVSSSGAAAASSFVTLVSTSLANCVVGKVVVIDYTVAGTWSTLGTGTPDYQLFVNGVLVQNHPDELSATTWASQRSFYTHTTASAGTVTVEIKGQEFATYRVAVRMEEI